MKPNKYMLMLLATVAAYVLFEHYRPRPIDWRTSYASRDKIPFGTRALYDLLPPVLGQATIPTLRVPVYNHLTADSLPPRSNYLFVCQRLTLSPAEVALLLRYVQRGNTVFMSAYEFPDSLGRALGFQDRLQAPQRRDTALVNQFTNPALRRPGGYNFRHDDGRNYLTVTAARPVTVLARNARNEPTYLRIQHGRGQFLIHNLPLALTNYYVLDSATADYAFKTLSYLPAGPTFWDEYQNQGRFDADEQSIFRYVRSQPALHGAYWLGLIGLVLYALFAGKRTQRVIPVLEPPRNTSLDFVQTIGQLYFQQGDHNNLAHKRIRYFLADVRDRFALPTNRLDDAFADLLARKSGRPGAEVGELVTLLRHAQATTRLSEYDLLRINAAIERFYHDT